MPRWQQEQQVPLGDSGHPLGSLLQEGQLLHSPAVPIKTKPQGREARRNIVHCNQPPVPHLYPLSDCTSWFTPPESLFPQEPSLLDPHQLHHQLHHPASAEGVTAAPVLTTDIVELSLLRLSLQLRAPGLCWDVVCGLGTL